MKEKLRAFLENKIVSTVMMITTVYALIGTDIVSWMQIPKEHDSTVVTISFIALVLFFLEFFISWFAKPGYGPIVGKDSDSFFYYLDFIAALSLFPDVPWLMDPMLAAIGLGGGAVGGSGLALARAGRAARAGARAGRIARVFKLISKVTPAIRNFFAKEEYIPEEVEEEDDLGDLEPSAIGTVFSDLMTQKAIVGVMAMLIATSMLDYEPVPPADVLALQQIESANGDVQDRLIKQYDESSQKSGIPHLVYLNIKGEERRRNSEIIHKPIDDQGQVSFDKYAEPILRQKEVIQIATENGSYAWFDKRDDESLKSKNAFWMTVFVVVLLGTGAMFFQSDAQNLFIGPIERMTKIVRDLSANPLMTISGGGGGGGDEDEDETKLVQNALTKISGLLQIGFGEAGAEIIANNLSSGGDLNAMIPGEKIEAIFGFCDIRSFTDATECLQEDVMLFVNNVADIVHHATKESGGAPNKNIGDAFLLVWKFRDRDSSKLAEDALRSFVRVVKESDASQGLKKLTDHPELQSRIPGFKISMGFGLHTGWAIEGAIGSQLKVDASYLSPHVNMSARLETATKQYGATILFSGQIHDLLPEESDLHKRIRQLDCITVKGSEVPLVIYTYDVYDPVFADDSITLDDYYEEFRLGLALYNEGDWEGARGHFDNCTEVWPADLTPQVLTDYMAEFDFKAPEGWDGVRALTSK